MATTTQTLELNINGASCSATLTPEGRCELRILTGAQGWDEKVLFKSIGTAMSRIAHKDPLHRGQEAAMSRESTIGRFKFCRNVGRGLWAGDISIYRVHAKDARGNGNHEGVQSL